MLRDPQCAYRGVGMALDERVCDDRVLRLWQCSYGASAVVRSVTCLLQVPVTQCARQEALFSHHLICRNCPEEPGDHLQAPSRQLPHSKLSSVRLVRGRRMLTGLWARACLPLTCAFSRTKASIHGSRLSCTPSSFTQAAHHPAQNTAPVLFLAWSGQAAWLLCVRRPCEPADVWRALVSDSLPRSLPKHGFPLCWPSHPSSA